MELRCLNIKDKYSKELRCLNIYNSMEFRCLNI